MIRPKRGFTLLELMLVIAILAIIIAIAIPNILSSRKFGNEAAAVGALKSIITSQSLFREKDKENDGEHDYGNLQELGASKIIDEVLATGTKQGFHYATDAASNAVGFLFYAVANPAVLGQSADRAFATNHMGVLYYTTLAVPPGTMPTDAKIPAGMIEVK